MTTSPDSATILDEADIQAAIERMAASIMEHSRCSHPLAIVGLLSRGDIIAGRIARRLEQAGIPVSSGSIDISLYRDDFFQLESKPSLRSTDLPFSTDDMRIVLVDDVLNTGRTIRAALNAIFDYGRPSCIELAALIDRGGREVPIQPDHVGFVLPDRGEKIRVSLKESDGIDQVTRQHQH